MHKTRNLLNYLPKSSQPKAKQALHEIWMAETRKKAEEAFDWFIETYDDAYPKATNCLLKDREELLAFYDFPKQHWVHLRTTNPIESTFTTIRQRTARTKGCVSRNTMLAMVYKLGTCAQSRWRRLRGFDKLAKLIRDVPLIGRVHTHSAGLGWCGSTGQSPPTGPEPVTRPKGASRMSDARLQAAAEQHLESAERRRKAAKR